MHSSLARQLPTDFNNRELSLGSWFALRASIQQSIHSSNFVRMGKRYSMRRPVLAILVSLIPPLLAATSNFAVLSASSLLPVRFKVALCSAA
jgi:hypothetical protein